MVYYVAWARCRWASKFDLIIGQWEWEKKVEREGGDVSHCKKKGNKSDDA